MQLRLLERHGGSEDPARVLLVVGKGRGILVVGVVLLLSVVVLDRARRAVMDVLVLVVAGARSRWRHRSRLVDAEAVMAVVEFVSVERVW